MKRFKECLKFVLKWEGGYTPPQSGDPNPTNFGIIQAVYDAYLREKGLPSKPVQLITMPEVEEIYLTQYWLKAKCNLLPQPLDLVVFDTGVNMGVGTAIKLLQQALNKLLKGEKVKVDGVIGKETLSAIGKVPLKGLVATFLTLRKGRYIQIVTSNPLKRRFLRGWLNRLSDLEKQVERELSPKKPAGKV